MQTSLLVSPVSRRTRLSDGSDYSLTKRMPCTCIAVTYGDARASIRKETKVTLNSNNL